MTDRSLETLLDEVALGLASDAQTARIEALAQRDADVARRLEAARARFAPLDDTAPVLALPGGFWDRISALLDAPETPETAIGTGQTVAPAGPSGPEGTSGEVVDLAAMRARLGRWRRAAKGAIAASVLLACVAGWGALRQVDPLVVAVLMDAEGEAVALIESGADNTTRVTLLERPDMAGDRVMQVWTKPDAAGPPVSLGLLSEGASRTLSIEGLPRPGPRQLYEITSEPAGGSPTNLPTGPILGVGLAKAPLL